MITFPPEYVQIPKYIGYVWNKNTKELYSYKGGRLRPMLKREVNGYVKDNVRSLAGFKHYYIVSHEGRARTIPYERLLKLNDVEVDQTVPYVKKTSFIE